MDEYGLCRQHPETQYFSGWTTRGNNIPSPEMKHQNGAIKFLAVCWTLFLIHHQCVLTLMIGAGPLAGSRSRIQRYSACSGATAFGRLIFLIPMTKYDK